MSFELAVCLVTSFGLAGNGTPIGYSFILASPAYLGFASLESRFLPGRRSEKASTRASYCLLSELAEHAVKGRICASFILRCLGAVYSRDLDAMFYRLGRCADDHSIVAPLTNPSSNASAGPRLRPFSTMTSN